MNHSRIEKAVTKIMGIQRVDPKLMELKKIKINNKQKSYRNP